MASKTATEKAPKRERLIDVLAALQKGEDLVVVREWAGETTAYVTASMLRQGRYNGGRVPVGTFEYRAEVLKDRTGSKLWAKRVK